MPDPFASFINGHTQSPILSLIWRPTSLTLSFISTLLLSFLTYSNPVPLESLCWPSTFTSMSHLLPLQHFNPPCHLPTSSAIFHPRSHSLILLLIHNHHTAAPSLIPTPSSAISSPYPKPINSNSTSLSLALFSHLAPLHLNLYYWLWLFIYIHSLLSPTPYQKLLSFIPPLQYCTPQNLTDPILYYIAPLPFFFFLPTISHSSSLTC